MSRFTCIMASHVIVNVKICIFFVEYACALTKLDFQKQYLLPPRIRINVLQLCLYSDDISQFCKFLTKLANPVDTYMYIKIHLHFSTNVKNYERGHRNKSGATRKISDMCGIFLLEGMNV